MDPRQPGQETPEDADAARDAAAAAEFGAALDAYESARPQPPAEEVAASTSPPPAATEPEKPGKPARKSGTLRLGQRVRGKVVTVSEDTVLVDYGGRSEAVVDARELRTPEGALEVQPGQALDLVVTALGETVTLGKGAKGGGGGGKSRRSLEPLRQAKDADLPVRGKVTGVNKGGITVDIDGARGFCPLSQIDVAKVEDPAPLVGKVLEFLVTEVDAARNNAVLSRRRFLLREQQHKAKERLASLAPGQDVEGTVTRLEPFGAFIDLGGLEGLAHVTELAHARVGHPRDVVAVGDRVQARILKVEPAPKGRTRVSLSLKAATPDPWATAAERFTPGSRVSGVVVRLTDFGAFVNLAPGIDGLLHVSQVSDKRIAHVRDVLTPGQGVEVTVLAVEPDKRRVSLSMREDAGTAPPPPSRMTRDEGARPPRGRPGGGDRGEGPRRERGARPQAGSERFERRERGERGERREGADRGGDRERHERTFASSRSASEPEPLTPMQLAFKRARESAERTKASRGGGNG